MMRRHRLFIGYVSALLSVWIGMTVGGGVGVATGLWLQYDASVARTFITSGQVSQRGFFVVCLLTMIGAAGAVGAVLLWKQLCLKTGLLSNDEVNRILGAGRRSKQT